MIDFPKTPGFWSKVRPFIFPAIALMVFFSVGVYFIITKVIPAAKETKTAIANISNQIIENSNISKDALNALNQNPPEHNSAGLDTKTINNGKTVVVSEGNLSSDAINKLSSLAGQTGTAGTPYDIKFTDTTGKYAYLIDSLKSYMATSLLWTKQELPSLYEVRLVNAGATGWSGMYNGSYSTFGSQITSVYAYIDLNTYYYDNSPYILEYLQMTLSHEYGHHFTLYNKWLTYQIPYSARFPDSYYQTRPLSYSNTAADYSLGWAGCDAEIAAEDYKYLFSPYKNQQMAGTYGYPSDPATRNWFLAFGKVNTTSDTVLPTVSILSPAASAVLAGSAVLSASASDNIAVAKVEFFLNSTSLGLATKSASSWSLNFNSKSQTNGDYILRATACDQSNNCKDASENISINNPVADTTPPSVTITSPSEGQTLTGTIDFSAQVSDNIKVSKADFYLDNSLLASKSLAPYAVSITTTSYANGSHTIKVIASDGLNNTSKEISVNFNNTTSSDTERPTVQITAPSDNPHDWHSGNLVVTAIATDNVGVAKIELYINDNLVASENSGSISRQWMSRGTPAGSYTLKVKAYDAAGNTAESSITIVKQ